jgi:hypothetical protein
MLFSVSHFASFLFNIFPWIRNKTVLSLQLHLKNLEGLVLKKALRLCMHMWGHYCGGHPGSAREIIAHAEACWGCVGGIDSPGARPPPNCLCFSLLSLVFLQHADIDYRVVCLQSKQSSASRARPTDRNTHRAAHHASLCTCVIDVPGRLLRHTRALAHTHNCLGLDFSCATFDLSAHTPNNYHQRRAIPAV